MPAAGIVMIVAVVLIIAAIVVYLVATILALRDASYGSASARALYPGGRPERPEPMPRSPVIGTDSPVQYPERTDGADSSSV